MLTWVHKPKGTVWRESLKKDYLGDGKTLGSYTFKPSSKLLKAYRLGKSHVTVPFNMYVCMYVNPDWNN